MDFNEQGDAEQSKLFFEQCLEMARRVEDYQKEAECYQQIANIYEAQGDHDKANMEKAIDYLNQFLDICLKHDMNEKKGIAYKRLSEVESKNGNTAKAIQYLGNVLNLAN